MPTKKLKKPTSPPKKVVKPGVPEYSEEVERLLEKDRKRRDKSVNKSRPMYRRDI